MAKIHLNGEQFTSIEYLSIELQYREFEYIEKLFSNIYIWIYMKHTHKYEIYGKITQIQYSDINIMKTHSINA